MAVVANRDRQNHHRKTEQNIAMETLVLQLTKVAFFKGHVMKHEVRSGMLKIKSGKALSEWHKTKNR